MKLATGIVNDVINYGLIEDGFLLLPTDTFKQKFNDLKSVLVKGCISELEKDVRMSNLKCELSKLVYLPPVLIPEKIICVGLNYEKPYPVKGDSPPKSNDIILFGKETSSLVGHMQMLEIPSGKAAFSFDYEGEIAVVIGKGGRDIKPEDVSSHILGYTIFNDGSVREWQKHSIYAGKNFQNSGSWGPYISTKDEISDHSRLRLTTMLNDNRVQDTTSDQMIFSIEQQVSYASSLFELTPGDIIATGSPDGTGGSQTPRRHLVAGDTVKVSVSGIGDLINTVG
jgi:2-keto-4-pentenoate hydratase/2-oxohepta-3-ene-1,7-dioic acid hydratase in catechol pathway